jgi:hypothetical protein
VNIPIVSKDYNSDQQGEIVGHLQAVLRLLKIELSEYCEVNISFSISGGKVSERIDTNIHNIHKKRG